MDPELPRGVARLINPEAGSHVVSLDPDERAAAMAATARSWQEFPYYPQRYGARGWKFSLSDSGWLQTLSDLPEHEAREQAFWLASVLAARGMPSCLLARHLELMHEELLARLPHAAGRYQRLLLCRDALRDRRRRHLDEASLQAVAAAFEAETRDEPGRVANMGVLLACAVADERAGLVRAVEAVLEWAADPERFTSTWCAAVRATMAATRAAPAGAPA